MKKLFFILLLSGCWEQDCINISNDSCIEINNTNTSIEEVEYILNSFSTVFITELYQIELTDKDTIKVSECITKDMIDLYDQNLYITFLPEPFIPIGYNKPCMGSELYGTINVVIKEDMTLKQSALIHELFHWVDELCGVPVDYSHIRKDWWELSRVVNKKIFEGTNVYSNL